MESRAKRGDKGTVKLKDEMEKLREELRASFKNRAILYYLIFDELRQELGQDRAAEILMRAIYRRGEQVGVVPEKLIDAHGIFAYAGIAAERLALRKGRFENTDTESEMPWERWFGAARRGREELARIAKLIGLSRPADEFYSAYCEEAERLLDPVWKTVDELAEALLERRELMGHHVDRLVHGEEVLERPMPPI